MKSIKLVKSNSLLSNLKTIETIDRDVLRKIIDTVELGKSKYNETYDNEKQFLETLYKKIGEKSNNMIVQYKKPDIGIGRVNPIKSLSLSMIRRPLRHTLAEGYYIDIDIKNCQPTLLHQICLENGIKCENLEKYVNNRELILEEIRKEYGCEREDAKNLFINLIFLGSFDSWAIDLDINQNPTDYICCLVKELKEIAKIIAENNPELHNKNKDRSYPLASTTSFFLQDYERSILDVMYSHVLEKKYLGTGVKPKVVLCHDGLMIPKNDLINISNLLEELEKDVKDKTGFDIKLEVKPFSEKIDINNLHEIKKENNKDYKFEHTQKFNSNYCNSLGDYDLKKRYFELFVCKVMRPSPMYIYSEYNKQEKQIESIYFQEKKLIEAFRQLNDKFINEWIKDDLRMYNDLIFKPINPGLELNNESSEEYNTFTGYSPLIKTPVMDNTIIDEWKNVVFQLCEGIQENYDYYIRFLAQMIQFPEKRTGVSILFRSNEGVGKNQHLEAIQNIITKSYFFSSAKKDDFVGKFALAFQNKLLLNWNETGSCADSIDEIKSKITDEYVTVEKKGIDKIECKNYARIIFTTNNMCPLPISDSNRRFVIFQSTDYYIENGGVKFWTKFNETINNPEFIACLYNYLNSIDLSEWEYKTFPKTKAYNQMRSLYISPEIMFIMDYIVNHPKSAKVKGSDLFGEYNDYCELNKLNQKYKPNVKEFYAKMENLKMDGINGVTKSSMKGGVVGFELNLESIKKSLKDKNYIDESDDNDGYNFIDEKKIKKDIDY